MGLTQTKDVIPDRNNEKAKQSNSENKFPDYHVSALQQLSREELIKDNVRRSEEVQWMKKRYQELLEINNEEMIKKEEKLKAELQYEKNKNVALSQLLTHDLNKSTTTNGLKLNPYENILVCQNFHNLLKDCYKKNPESPLQCNKNLQNFQKCLTENK